MPSPVGRRASRPVRAGLAVVLALALVAAPAPARALQDSPTTGPAAGIEPGSAVRVRTVDRGSYEGWLRSGDLERVTLRIDGRTETFEVSDIGALWTGGRAVGQGAWIGALAGGVPALAYGALLCHAYTEPGSSCGDWDRIAVLGLLGAGAGAAAGALIGAFVRTWDLRWPKSAIGADIGLTAEGRVFVGLDIGT